MCHFRKISYLPFHGKVLWFVPSHTHSFAKNFFLSSTLPPPSPQQLVRISNDLCWGQYGYSWNHLLRKVSHVFLSCFTQEVSHFFGSELVWQLTFKPYCYWVTEIQLVSSFCLCWLWFTIILFFFCQGKPFTSIEPSSDINDLCLYPDSGEQKKDTFKA